MWRLQAYGEGAQAWQRMMIAQRLTLISNLSANISRRLGSTPLRVTSGPPGGTNEDQGPRLAGTRVFVLGSCGQRRAAPQGMRS